MLCADGEFSRGRKRAPEVAYKCHEFFDSRADTETRGRRAAESRVRLVR